MDEYEQPETGSGEGLGDQSSSRSEVPVSTPTAGTHASGDAQSPEVVLFRVDIARLELEKVQMHLYTLLSACHRVGSRRILRRLG